MHDSTNRHTNLSSSAMSLGNPSRLLNINQTKLSRPSQQQQQQQQNPTKKLKVNHTNGVRSTSHENNTTVRSLLFILFYVDRMKQLFCYYLASKNDTSLRCPLRQTLPIFKQPVTYYPTQRDEVKSQVMNTNNQNTTNSNTTGKPSEKTKPRQLFWEKRFQNIRATDIDGQPFEHFKLPEQIKGILRTFLLKRFSLIYIRPEKIILI